MAIIKKIRELLQITSPVSTDALPLQRADLTTGYALLQDVIPQISSGVLTGTQANSTTTPAIITGQTFTVPAGKRAVLNAQAAATLAATTTGLVYGFRIVTPVTTGSVVGSWFTIVNQSNAPDVNAFTDGDIISVGSNATVDYTTTAQNSTAGNNGAMLTATIFNNTTSVITVNVTFATEVAGSAATLQAGSSFTAMVY